MRDARVGQRRARRERISRTEIGIIRRPDMGQRLQRQAEAHGRIAGEEKQPSAARAPNLAQPSGLRLRRPALDRQHEALGHVEPLIEHPRHPRAFFRIGQSGIAGIDIRR